MRPDAGHEPLCAPAWHSRFHSPSGAQVTAEGQAWGGAGARAQPPSASILQYDDLPRGPDDCLSGETFVFTGNLPRLSRYEPIHCSRESPQLMTRRH